MPIKFRCEHCGQLLSISRRKAGTAVTCPQCVHRTMVPSLEGSEVAPGDDSHLRAEIASPETLDQTDQPPAEAAWKQHPNPWRDEEEEEDDFQLNKPGLQEAGLDMTPMVDVTFLLLIFFMITASFSLQKSLETTSPKPDDPAALSLVIEDLEDESVVVTIDESNNIFVDDTPVAGISELTDILAAKIANENKTEMLIEADRNASHGTVVAVTDAGIEVQMQNIRRSTRKGDD